MKYKRPFTLPLARTLAVSVNFCFYSPAPPLQAPPPIHQPVTQDHTMTYEIIIITFGWRIAIGELKILYIKWKEDFLGPALL